MMYNYHKYFSYGSSHKCIEMFAFCCNDAWMMVEDEFRQFTMCHE